MASSFVQSEEANFNNGFLPPLRELFLEIQVNKLIQEYLFSSNADEMCGSLHDDSSEHKENSALDKLYATDMALWSACNAPCVKSTEALDCNHKQSPHDLHRGQRSQASLTVQGITCVGDYGITGQDRAATGSALLTVNTPNEASLATLSVESGDKGMHKTAQLSRVGTFPCTRKVQLQVGMLSRVNTEMKASGKKPPRPPKLPKSELSLNLTRCCPDSGVYLQTSRTDRKRKAMAASRVNTSIWALLFTLCFAIVMIAQGIGSQDSENFSAYGRDASSPMQTFMRATTKQSPEEANFTGAAERRTSMESVLAEREASTEGVLAQPYVMRKLQLQHLSHHMKHLELDTYPKL